MAKLLRGVNVVAVGENEKANHQLSELLAPLLAYSPMSVPELIEGYRTGNRGRNCTFGRRRGGADGGEFRARTTVTISESFVGDVRCERSRALARGDCWAWIFGMITIWVDDEESAKLSEQNPERVSATGGVRVGGYSGGFERKRVKRDEKEKTVRAVLEGVKALVDNDEHFAGKKSLYTRMGCRGDWPILQAPEWDGSVENFSENGLSGEEKVAFRFHQLRDNGDDDDAFTYSTHFSLIIFYLLKVSR